jgi:hypothetical protein
MDMGSMMSMFGGITEGVQGILMSYQGAEGSEETAKKIKEHREKYPTYEIPSSIVTATDMYRQMAQSPTLPGQSLYEQQIGAGTAQGIAQSREVSTSAADLLGATTNLYGQQNQAMTNLQIEAARQQAMNKQGYGNMLGMKAQYEDKAFTWNEAIPWQQRMNELQNTMQGYMDLVTQGQSTLTASFETFGGGSSGGSYAPTNTSTGSSGGYDYSSMGIQTGAYGQGNGMTQMGTADPSRSQYQTGTELNLDLGTSGNYYGG